MEDLHGSRLQSRHEDPSSESSSAMSPCQQEETSISLPTSSSSSRRKDPRRRRCKRGSNRRSQEQTSSLWLTVLLILAALVCSDDNIAQWKADAREIVATKEWQKLGVNDTVPAGLEIRMDLSGGGRWARLMPPQEDSQQGHPPDVDRVRTPRCGPSCQQRQAERRGGLRGRTTSRQHRKGQQFGDSSISSSMHDASGETHVAELSNDDWSPFLIVRDFALLLGFLFLGAATMHRCRRYLRMGTHEL